MAKISGEYPYDEYNVYLVHHKGMNRMMANLVHKVDGKANRFSMSYARYLVSVREGRILEDWEQVDHIDDDKTNDSIDNLQILTVAENNRKEAKRKGKKFAKLVCPYCGVVFEREYRNTYVAKKKGTYTACSRKCATTFGALLQHYPDDEDLFSRIFNIIDVFQKYE